MTINIYPPHSPSRWSPSLWIPSSSEDSTGQPCPILASKQRVSLTLRLLLYHVGGRVFNNVNAKIHNHQQAPLTVEYRMQNRREDNNLIFTGTNPTKSRSQPSVPTSVSVVECRYSSQHDHVGDPVRSRAMRQPFFPTPLQSPTPVRTVKTTRGCVQGSDNPPPSRKAKKAQRQQEEEGNGVAFKSGDEKLKGDKVKASTQIPISPPIHTKF